MVLPDNFWVGVFGSLIFGFIGVVLLLGGFKLFDWLTPKVDFQQKMHDNPIAAAIVVAAFFLSVAHIIASVVH